MYRATASASRRAVSRSSAVTEPESGTVTLTETCASLTDKIAGRSSYRWHSMDELPVRCSEASTSPGPPGQNLI